MENYQFIPLDQVFGPIQPFSKYEFFSDRVHVRIDSQHSHFLMIEQKEHDGWVKKLLVDKNFDDYRVYFDIDKRVFSLMKKGWEVFRFNFDHYLLTQHREVMEVYW